MHSVPRDVTLPSLDIVVVVVVVVVPSDGVFPRAFRVLFPTVNKGFRAIFADLRTGLEPWAYVAFTGTLSWLSARLPHDQHPRSRAP